MPRKTFKPTQTDRQDVRRWAQHGLSHNDIAKLCKISPKTLRKHFQDELDRGPSEQRAMIADGLFQAIHKGSVPAILFAHRTRVHAAKRRGDAPDEPTVEVICRPPPRTVYRDEYTAYPEVIIDLPGAPPGTPPILIHQTPSVYNPSSQHVLTTYPEEWLRGEIPMRKQRTPEIEAGRKPYKPTDDDRKMVRRLGIRGLPQADIARLLRISPKTLRKHFRDELDLAAIDLKITITSALHKLIQKGETAALVYAMKNIVGGLIDSSQTEENELAQRPKPKTTIIISVPDNGREYVRGYDRIVHLDSRDGRPPIPIRTFRVNELPLQLIPIEWLPPELLAIRDKYVFDYATIAAALDRVFALR
jgi:DNA-binding CsgD family transcriptional regulator